jgi:hypothetical protein
MLRVISCRRRLLGAEAKKATICRVAPSQPPSHVGAETRNIVSFSFEGLCDVGFLACRQGRHSFFAGFGRHLLLARRVGVVDVDVYLCRDARSGPCDMIWVAGRSMMGETRSNMAVNGSLVAN